MPEVVCIGIIFDNLFSWETYAITVALEAQLEHTSSRMLGADCAKDVVSTELNPFNIIPTSKTHSSNSSAITDEFFGCVFLFYGVGA